MRVHLISEFRHRRMGGVLFAALLLLFPLAVAAQEDCSTAFSRASRQFEAGELRDVVSILTPCVESGGLSGDEKWLSYRLLALTYLYMDNPAEADRCVDKMLKINPRYVTSVDRDPSEFAKLLDSYAFFPRLSLGIQVGGTFANPNVLRSYSLLSIAPPAATYGASIGFIVGGNISYRFNIDWSLTGRVMYTSSGFTKKVRSANNFSLDYHEDITSLGLPVLLGYRFNTGFATGYVQAGAFVRSLMSAKGGVSGTSDSLGTTALPDASITERRKSADFGVALGAGAIMPVGTAEVSLDILYLHGLQDVVVGGQRYSNPSQVFGFGHVDDDFSLRDFTVSLGYQLPLDFQAYKIAQ